MLDRLDLLGRCLLDRDETALPLSSDCPSHEDVAGSFCRVRTCLQSCEHAKDLQTVELEDKVDRIAELLSKEAEDELHRCSDVLEPSGRACQLGARAAPEDRFEVHVLGEGDASVEIETEEIAQPLLLAIDVRPDLFERSSQRLAARRTLAYSSLLTRPSWSLDRP